MGSTIPFLKKLTAQTQEVNRGILHLKEFFNIFAPLPKFVGYWRGGRSRKSVRTLWLTKQLRFPTQDYKTEKPRKEVFSVQPVLIPRQQFIIDIDYLGDNGETLRQTQGWNPTQDLTIQMAMTVRFIESIEIMPDGKISVTGRRKTVRPDNRGRLTKFSTIYQNKMELYGCESMGILDESMVLWEHDVTIVLADIKQFKTMPEWRLKWDSENQDTLMTQLVTSPNLTESLLLKINEFFGTHNKQRINAPECEGKISKFYHSKFLRKVDEEDRWTPTLINSEIKKLIRPPEEHALSMWNFHNIKATVSMFEISLIASEEELGIDWNLNRRGQEMLQEWILDNQGMEIPISLIHSFMTLPYISRHIKDKAQTKYRSRQKEFVEYMDSLHEHEEGGVMPND
tara:strand:+ start:350 stop:1543 length:1194 start_codon:yes stop_codon:yes gene_type:complete